jgi:hypothetical protein
MAHIGRRVRLGEVSRSCGTKAPSEMLLDVTNVRRSAKPLHSFCTQPAYHERADIEGEFALVLPDLEIAPKFARKGWRNGCRVRIQIDTHLVGFPLDIVHYGLWVRDTLSDIVGDTTRRGARMSAPNEIGQLYT